MIIPLGEETLLDVFYISVRAYSVEVRTIAAGSFLNGLMETVKDDLAAREDTNSLDSRISLAIKVDNHLRERRRERGSSRPSHSPVPRAVASSVFSDPPREESMQLGRTRLSSTERLHRMKA